MHYIIMLLTFICLSFGSFNKYKKTRKVYKLLFIIPFISIIIVESIEKFMHKHISSITIICLSIIFIVITIINWRLDKKYSKEKEL